MEQELPPVVAEDPKRGTVGDYEHCFRRIGGKRGVRRRAGDSSRGQRLRSSESNVPGRTDASDVRAVRMSLPDRRREQLAAIERTAGTRQRASVGDITGPP